MARTKGRWLDLDMASLIAKRAGCKSRKEYHDWHNRARPNNLPKNPNTVYANWTSWNDFLGTKNTFHPPVRESWRDYWEAVRWAQEAAIKYNLKNSSEYIRWCRNNGDKLPFDIPRRPDRVYDEWSGWKVWLGVSLQEKLLAAKQNVAVLALAYNSGMAKNYVEFIVVEEGFSRLKEIAAERQIEVFKVFVWEKELGDQVRLLCDHMGSSQGGNVWLIQNVNSLVFELSMILELYVPVKE